MPLDDDRRLGWRLREGRSSDCGLASRGVTSDCGLVSRERPSDWALGVGFGWVVSDWLRLPLALSCRFLLPDGFPLPDDLRLLLRRLLP